LPLHWELKPTTSKYQDETPTLTFLDFGEEREGTRTAGD